MGALVQATGAFNSASNSGQSQAYASNVHAGNLLLVGQITNNNNGATLSVSDSQSNSYTPMVSQVNNTGNNWILLSWYAIASASAACTVTTSYTTAGTFCRIFISEFSGATTMELATSVLNGTAPPTASLSPTKAPAVMWAMANSVNGISGVSSPFTTLTAESSEYTAYYLPSSAGTYTATFTDSSGDPFSEILASFYLPPPPPTIDSELYYIYS